MFHGSTANTKKLYNSDFQNIDNRHFDIKVDSNISLLRKLLLRYKLSKHTLKNKNENYKNTNRHM